MQVCERSLKNTQNGPSMPPVQHFVRAEMLPSGYLIRPCEGGGSIIHIVDHVDLEVHKSERLVFEYLCTLFLVVGFLLIGFMLLFLLSSHGAFQKYYAHCMNHRLRLHKRQLWR